jgi:hypothetical protein
VVLCPPTPQASLQRMQARSAILSVTVIALTYNTAVRCATAGVLAVLGTFGVIATPSPASTPVENTCLPQVNRPIWCGDGGPANHAGLVHPGSIDLTADGSLLIFDSGHYDDTDLALVRRVAPNGIISRVAGTGEAGSSGDGGPARRARISAREHHLGPFGWRILDS